ncbi:hypothetical protein JXJ21_05895 [candidate division KSB1 bacterium]|nr:hypothetical protein [candidate division KSB1 bacterium]
MTLIKFLNKHFPAGQQYLIQQRYPGEIDHFIINRVYNPDGRWHSVSGTQEADADLPAVGRRLGWIPNEIPVVFFSDSIEQEIANAVASPRNQASGGKAELERAQQLMVEVGIADLQRRNPFSLSVGETKIVWFLCQWAKSPDYLISGNLPNHLSPMRLERLIQFIQHVQYNATDLKSIKAPTILLGFSTPEENWIERFMQTDGKQQIKKVWFPFEETSKNLAESGCEYP